MLRRAPKLSRRGPTLALGVCATLALMFAPVVGCRQSAPARTQANTLVGVGGSFPALLYTRWAQDYRARTGVAVNYQGVGSGPATDESSDPTADFLASEVPLRPEQLRAGLYRFPTVVGAITPVVHVSGVAPGQLKLTGPLLGDIFLGAVTRWNDPRIVALNPSLKLSDEPIAVAHRALPSGTTLLFTTYLSKVSPAWKAKAGAGEAVAWPVGAASRGSGGIVAFVQQTPGAIGYLGYAYAKQNDLAYVQLQNRHGTFVAPGVESIAAALGADWASEARNGLSLIDRPAAGAWPITGATFILIEKQPPKPEKTRQVLAFFDWAYRNGDADAASLGFAPLPPAMKDAVRKQWAATIRDPSGQPVFKPSP